MKITVKKSSSKESKTVYWMPRLSSEILENSSQKVTPKAIREWLMLSVGGFPCQPFSVAGKGKAADDSRNMWPPACEVINIIQPSYAFLENVPGLISCGYLGNILQDLAEIGYNARWCCLSAEKVGAPHKRERLWIVAHTRRRRWDAFKHETRIPYKNCSWWSSKYELQDIESLKCTVQKYPECLRMVDGISDPMDRLKAAGNGQVPQVAATAWRLLTE